ncbi:uncharacterized protein Z518_06934 [Rhinocladiella mackenziei CBS 650.93]|uniref:non-specific serine/threonine protein kinase n=1 Tax=Rhinocladiella mackenziei CBS 650.93 TaxID=1442369 RepID=A0A0D2FMU9_9EURO|nr:uncharacterized protein Z518_06934 [Rhinocladiella mackenziei CBS 650.93]KIX03382.1 hypothetical protein Z518_06934 [Rhinocladiella mackenziei CBS 650.93]
MASPKTESRVVPVSQTPKKAVNSVPHDDTQTYRLHAFIYNLDSMTHVEDTEVSIFEKLHNMMAKNAKFTETQIKRAEEALKTSDEWVEWRSDMKAQEVLQAQSVARTRQAHNVVINIGTKVLGSGIGNEDYAECLKVSKLDLASIAIDVDKENVRFCDMKTTWQLKKSADQTYAQSEIQLSLLRCNQAFGNDPFRHFIYSIYVAGTTLRLYQLNRGQVLCYESELDIAQNTLGFLRFVNWLMLARNDAQGLAKRPSAIGRRVISFTPPGCKIPSPLVRVGVDGVTTRGTTIWPIEMQKPKPKKKKSRKLTAKKDTENLPTEGDDLAELKMAWIDEVRTNEADILYELSDVEELLKLFEWEDGPLTAEFDVLPEAKHSREHLKMGPNYRYMKVTHSKSSITANKTQKKEAEKGLFMPEVNGTAIESADEPSYARRQRWYLEEYCGVSVDTSRYDLSQHQYPNPRDVTELERMVALRSAVRAIQKMCCRDRPVVHRDISPANIMVMSPDTLSEEGAPPPGRLIDLDMACVYGDPHSGAPWRTGTYLYMAIDILMGEHPRHNPWHDIESVFWALLFGERNRTTEGAKELQGIVSAVEAQPTEAKTCVQLGYRKLAIVGYFWNTWMGGERSRLFGKTSFPVIRLMHRPKAELFEFDERKEPDRLATFEDVAAAADEHIATSIIRKSPKFAVPEEGGKVEIGIEGLSLEEKADKTNQDKSNNPANEEGVEKAEKDVSIERIKRAVATITERIDEWFAECIDDPEKAKQACKQIKIEPRILSRGTLGLVGTSPLEHSFTSSPHNPQKNKTQIDHNNDYFSQP